MAAAGDRAVSTLVGFILLFGFLTISFSIYQGAVVPDQNKATEFEHNKQVQAQMQELRNAFVGAASGNTKRTVAIALGAKYPRRTIAQNLGVSGGGVGTFTYDGGSEFSIENANGTDLYGETRDFWNGTQKNYSTKGFLYRPLYSFYANPPETIYENTLLFNDFGQGRNVSITDQALIKGNRITLVSLVGNVSRSGQDTVSIDPDSVSASTNTVSIENASSGRLNVTIPTRLSSSFWNETLRQDEQLAAEGGNVLYVNDTGPDEVSLVLENGTYRLRMAKVGVGSGVSEEDPAYLTLTDRPGRTVLNDSSHYIELEVRDRFNNPVTGTKVTASVDTGSGTFGNGNAQTTVASTASGKVAFNYTAPDTDGTREDLSFDIGNSDAKTAAVNLTVRKPT